MEMNMVQYVIVSNPVGMAPGVWQWGVAEKGKEDAPIVTMHGGSSLIAALAFIKALEAGTASYNGWTHDATRYMKEGT